MERSQRVVRGHMSVQFQVRPAHPCPAGRAHADDIRGAAFGRAIQKIPGSQPLVGTFASREPQSETRMMVSGNRGPGSPTMWWRKYDRS